METEALHTFFMVVSFAFGATIGSFLNVCIHRIPKDQSLITPGSTCPKCNTPIRWYDNIPIVSWLILRAKCRHCGAPIHWRYPLVEAITGVMFLLVFLKHGFMPVTPVYMLLGAALILVTFVDLSDWIIPNEVTFPGIPLGIVWGMAVMFFGDATGGVIPHAYETVFDALLGVLLGGGSLWLLDWLCLKLLGKRGMGFGDVKLLAMLGAFFGWQSVVVIIMLASVVGSVVGVLMIALNRVRGQSPAPEAEGETAETDEPHHLGDEDEEPIPVDGNYLPFGPYLALAGIIMMFFGKELFVYYYSTFISPATISTIPL